MPQLVVVPSIETQRWKEFANHFEISYLNQDFWNSTEQKYTLNDQTSLVVVAEFNWIKHLWQYQRTDLELFLTSNKIIIVGNTDAPVMLVQNLYYFEQFDTLDYSKNISVVVESTECVHKFKNINLYQTSASVFFDLIEQRITLKIHKTLTKDFLLLFGRESNERTQLWSNLTTGSTSSNSIVQYHRVPGGSLPQSEFIGDQTLSTHWQRSLIPNIDLYNQCAFEVVSETITDIACWHTEKTIRPIAAKTPFILLSVPGALKNLKLLGFKTFSHLISERYDREPDLMTRINMVSLVVKDIVSTGAAEFYRECQDIVEHNWNQLAEIKGTYLLKQDQRYINILSAHGIFV